MGKHAKARPPRRTARTAAAIAVVGTVVTGPTLAFANGAKAATSSEWDSVAQCEASGDWSINWSSDGLSVGGLQFQSPSWQDALSYLSSRGYDVSSWPQSLHQGMSNVPTRDEQILAGEALLHLQGAGAWTTVSDGCASLGTSMFDGGPNPWGLPGTQWPGAGGSTSTPPPSTSGGSGQSDGSSASSEGEDGGSDTSSAAVAPATGEGEDGGSDSAAEPTSSPASTPSAPAPVAATASAPASTHTVVKGEWLIKIAEAHYGDWTKWQLIYNANVGVIGSNPDLIFPGQVLTLPTA